MGSRGRSQEITELKINELKQSRKLFFEPATQAFPDRTRSRAMSMRAAGGNDLDVLLTEVQAADLLTLSVRTLQAWRARSFGPPYVRAGRAVRYRRRDLLAWTEAHVVVHSDERRSTPPSAG